MSKITLEEKASWLMNTLDIVADTQFGEFGFDTLDKEGKIETLKFIIEEGWIEIPD